MNSLSLSNFVLKTLQKNRVFPFLVSRTFSAGSSDGVSRTPGSVGKSEEIVDENAQPPIPTHKERHGESLDVVKARLLYQSRKRGTLENGLLLSTFASRYLYSMTPSQLEMYDKLINKPSNDWDIYYWIVGTKPVPDEYNNEMFALLQQHVKNEGKELRISQPDLLKH